MIATPIDPRAARWEVTDPAYRVYFWLVPPAPHMSVCREYRLTGAPDVNHVLAWGSSHAQTGEVAVVYVEHRDPEGGLGLIRLSGEDPQSGAHLTAK